MPQSGACFEELGLLPDHTCFEELRNSAKRYMLRRAGEHLHRRNSQTFFDFSLLSGNERICSPEILLNSIDRDGTYKGYEIELVKKVSSQVNIPLIACGGAGSISDFKNAVVSGASAVAAGSFFIFQRPHQAVLISYPGQEEMGKIRVP